MIRHFLINLDEQEKVADCSNCGRVSVYIHPYKNKTDSTKLTWICGRKLSPKVVKNHVLEHICEESKTAFCKNCGLVRILRKKDQRGNYFWKCNRITKGQDDRKKEIHRSNKKDFCELCGFVAVSPRQIDIHHKNHDHFDDRPENMISACCNCHRLQHIKSYEELDQIRQDGLIKRRNEAQANLQFDWKCLANLLHKNTKQLSHKLKDICEQSRTAFCERCGLVSIILRKDKQGYDYWCCNHGGKRQTYGKVTGHKEDIEKQFFRDNKKATCEKCGFIPVNSRQLDIHHLDGNHENNEKTNLSTRCANCHRLEHTKPQEEIDLERFCNVLTDRWTTLIKNY